MKKNSLAMRSKSNRKLDALASVKSVDDGTNLTTNQGLVINDDTNSLKGGERGPSLLEDFHLREKITHFDHERIPERVVHARGAAAHGFFQCYEGNSKLTKAGFLTDPSRKTPVFVRFSTVAGSRGSSDLARDVRGFAVKFYTDEGIFDLVGNNIPVFFIQDAVKFPDFVHAVKPEPHNEIPQAASAHDTFYDFISLAPETLHMLMWVMSDRAIPRSYRMIEGFGIHTFRLIDATRKSRFVKFHWKPLLGTHSVLWDEAVKISGADPDFHRRDLWDTIDDGGVAEWEFGVQVVEERDEHKFDFDLLDPTKLIPEELVPVQRLGKMTLNRNPDNFFAETEQVAFHPGHLVPGIDFTDDPLLQGRLFSYTDTQLTRLGGPNFAQIPINRPTCPMHNNQRDGHMQQLIHTGEASYHPNTVGSGCPMQAKENMGGFVSYAEKLTGGKVRGKSEKFFDHFSQATLFFRSQSEVEQNHIIDALTFELGFAKRDAIVQRMLFLLAKIDTGMANRIATGLGTIVPKSIEGRINLDVGADAGKETETKPVRKPAPPSPALSMMNTVKDTIKTRKIAFLAADGVDEAALTTMKKSLTSQGAKVAIIAPHGGMIKGSQGGEIPVDLSLLNVASVLFDAVYIPGGSASVAAILANAKSIHFVNEMYKHCKAIAATGEGVQLIRASSIPMTSGGPGENARIDPALIVEEKSDVKKVSARFIKAIAQHRNWDREKFAQGTIPA
ncbi:MAG TPA: catalase [Chthoniobacterales bacterium]|nr:catalase [Chthoniobacterales bacterium]